ncbi:MAG: Cell division protein ftsA [Candidatus Pacebacteria bacterium GW2011_GWF2_38_9]|nr:MAG: cell division protein FtsA [candidate division TM6 bacterium GW2011_GWF2_28_16]KKQ88901.1 MAG: Cell division protein ftsA [Candidatus Pacebacteria bacterium GW2011_GWF2_38_9]HAZ73077.1 cell division protein FtsA [Candidatus Paceibacterota bacterium]
MDIVFKILYSLYGKDMSKEQIIAAIDLGSDKCTTLISRVTETEKLQVLGFSVVPSRGMKRSMIIDLEQVLNTVSQGLDAAERMAGFSVKSAVVSISGVHIKYKNSRGVVAVAAADQAIIQSDVDRVIEAARAVSMPTDREIIHVIPKDFKVDSQEGIKDPVGMTGVRLEAEAHIITGLTTAMRNLEKCISDMGVKVDAFVFSALAASQIALTETEKELGAVLIDIGAGTTSLAAYVEGALEFSAVLPIGAKHITQDIALGCRIPMDDAEKLKLYLTDNGPDDLRPNPGESKVDFTKRKRKLDTVDPEKVGIAHNDFLSKKTLVGGIMEPRIREIFNLVMQELDRADLLSGNKVPAGLVLTGGGAMTTGLVEVAKKVSNLPVRLAFPEDIEGLTEDIKKPNFAVSVGLLDFALKQGNVTSVSEDFNWQAILPKDLFKKLFDKIKKTSKSILP